MNNGTPPILDLLHDMLARPTLTALVAIAVLLASPLAARAQPCPAQQWLSAGHCCPEREMWDLRFSRCTSDARARCVAGEYNACVTAGDHYALSGSAADVPQATRYYRLACHHGVATGCAALGMLELKNDPDGLASSRAARWLGRACDGQHLKACTALAELYLREPNGSRVQDGKVLLERTCEQGEPRACARLVLSQDGGATATACRRAQAAAQAGDPLGSLAYGRLQNAGSCNIENAHSVERLFEHACAGGEGEGCFELASLELSKPDTARALTKLRPWLELACEQRHAQACALLADDFLRGSFGPQDPTLARKHLGAACQLGVFGACARLGELLDTTAPRDPAGARAAWQAACRGGANAHCFGLAQHLLDHRVEAADRDEALALLARTCTAGHGEACSLLADVHGWRGAQMPRAQDALREFQNAREHAARACELGRSEACVNAALIELNLEKGAPERARGALQHACDEGLEAACGYLQHGPYPFPYGAQLEVPARFASLDASIAELDAPRPNTTAGKAQQPAAQTAIAPPVHAPQSVAPRSPEPAPLIARPLTLDLTLSPAKRTRLGAAVFSVRHAVTDTTTFIARLPMLGATVRLRDSGDAPQNVFALGNPELAATLVTERTSDRRTSYRAGFTLPLAPPVESQAEMAVALEAAADSGALEDGYLWAPNATGLVLAASHQLHERSFRIDMGATAAYLFAPHGRDDAELFAALYAFAGARLAGGWTVGLGLAGAGWVDAERLTLAIEPRVEHTDAAGRTVRLGLQITSWLSGDPSREAAPWTTLKLQASL